MFDTDNLHSYFRTYSHPEIRESNLRDFDLSCDAPVQTLDIQQPLSGNVSTHFTGVTFEAAAAHYRDFVESFQGYSPTEDHVTSEISFYIGFPCAGRDRPRRPAGRLAPE